MPYDLRCDRLINPLGHHCTSPLLSWKIADLRPGSVQSAYQIQADVNGKPAWDSGRIESRAQKAEWSGPALSTRDSVVWRVQTWDHENQESGWSASAEFEIGLIDLNVDGKWIGAPWSGSPRTSAPVPEFTKEFTLAQKSSACRLYISALGIYSVEINGQAVDDTERMAPGWTQYEKRVFLRTYDIASLLVEGVNTIKVRLGDGWYAGCVGDRGRQLFGEKPLFLAQIECGGVIVASDESWSVAPCEVVSADIMDGETWDLRKLANPTSPVAAVVSDPETALFPYAGPPVRIIRELEPISIMEKRGYMHAYQIDFGQNFAGSIRIVGEGKAGSTITIKYSEVLDGDGKLYTANLRAAIVTDRITLAEDGPFTFEPKFTFHGYRFAEITGVTAEPQAWGLVFSSDIPITGEFECSEPLINQLQNNILWSQIGNFVDVPTDCPQRDERLGWTGDAQVFFNTAAFNMDVSRFFDKWLDDLALAQGPNGEIPMIAPLHDRGFFIEGGPAWADALPICAWNHFERYGDLRTLNRLAPALKNFGEFILNASPNYIRCAPDYQGFRGFGDWLSTNAETPLDLIGTAFLAHSLDLLAKIFEAIGDTNSAATYRDHWTKTKAAFLNRFVTPGGLLVSQTQTSHVLALHFNLVEEHHRKAMVQALVDDIGNRRWKLSTGFIGTPYLLKTLVKGGRPDAAAKLLFQTEWPSWLYPVTQGATTIWERWDGWTKEKGFQNPDMNSFNHYAYGCVGEWLYETAAGLKVRANLPIEIEPLHVEGLEFCRATFESDWGKVESSWELMDGVMHLFVTVPPNAEALVTLPGNEVTEKPDTAVQTAERTWKIPAGSWTFATVLFAVDAAEADTE